MPVRVGLLGGFIMLNVTIYFPAGLAILAAVLIIVYGIKSIL